jgi:alkylation response protein AidB-like acyl-CoA dehydrogenase
MAHIFLSVWPGWRNFGAARAFGKKGCVMRASIPAADLAVIAAQIEASPDIDRVRGLNEAFGSADPESIEAILEEAEKFAGERLAPLNDVGDRHGCGVREGRVFTAPGHKAVWDAYRQGGWPGLEHSVEHGGQGLPLAVATSVQGVFDRSNASFCMLSVLQRAASRLIAAFGTAQMQAEWLPNLVSGAWGATICISEAEAGSDVARVRTRAEPNTDGSWSVRGEKCWITFGNHDLAERIGHCLLARTPGQKGLSLFLVPDEIDGWRNYVVVRRIEEKLGLHASPTCALGFDSATGWMIGQEGQGLQQMFVMITQMRLAVAAQGAGLASAARDVAMRYAAERLQGGPIGQAPVPIRAHEDVQRMLMDLTSRVEVLRGLILAIANQADLAAHEADADRRADAAALAQWLLPIVKTAGGEIAFANGSDAVQVLGGAGYTREWPVEQVLRDARVLTVFEGTTGIQAIDLLHRRLWRGDRRGLQMFVSSARASLERCPADEARRFGVCLDHLQAASDTLLGWAGTPREGNAGATAYLHLAMLAATGWIAARLAGLQGDAAAQLHLIAAGRYWLSDIDSRAAMLHAACVAGVARLEAFGNLRVPCD